MISKPPSVPPSSGPVTSKLADALVKVIAIGSLGVNIIFAPVATGPQNPQFCSMGTCSAISRVEYERLEIGMTLTQVEAILGPGTETYTAENRSQFRWQNSDDYRVEATFQEGKLIEKEQKLPD